MPGLAPYIRTLAAGARTNIEARGTTIFVRRTTEELRVSARSSQVGGGDGVTYTIRMGPSEKWFTAEEFDSVQIENTGSATTEIEVLIGAGDFFRPVPDIVNVAIIAAGVDVTSFFDVVDIDISAAGRILLAAQNLDRTQLIITALAANISPIRVGTVACTFGPPGVGIQLSPGETLLWESTAEVWACSETDNDQVVSLLEHTK